MTSQASFSCVWRRLCRLLREPLLAIRGPDLRGWRRGWRYAKGGGLRVARGQTGYPDSVSILTFTSTAPCADLTSEVGTGLAMCQREWRVARAEKAGHPRQVSRLSLASAHHTRRVRWSQGNKDKRCWFPDPIPALEATAQRQNHSRREPRTGLCSLLYVSPHSAPALSAFAGVLFRPSSKLKCGLPSPPNERLCKPHAGYSSGGPEKRPNRIRWLYRGISFVLSAGGAD